MLEETWLVNNDILVQVYECADLTELIYLIK